jgi:phosphatidylglycerophosphate synthase
VKKEKPFLHFFKRTFLASILLAILGWVLFAGPLQAYYLSIFPYLLLFFVFITNLFHGLLIRAGKKDMIKFSNKFMMYSGIKLFIYITVILVYIFMNKGDAAPFLLAFLVLYFVFTFMEVVSATRYFKNNSATKKKKTRRKPSKK